MFISENQLISTLSVDINAESESNVKLSFDENYIGEGKMRIELVDYPVYFDNTFYMSLPSTKITKIIHIHTKEYFTIAVEKVFGNKIYFSNMNLTFAYNELCLLYTSPSPRDS